MINTCTETPHLSQYVVDFSTRNIRTINGGALFSSKLENIVKHLLSVASDYHLPCEVNRVVRHLFHRKVMKQRMRYFLRKRNCVLFTWHIVCVISILSAIFGIVHTESIELVQSFSSVSLHVVSVVVPSFVSAGERFPRIII